MLDNGEERGCWAWTFLFVVGGVLGGLVSVVGECVVELLLDELRLKKWRRVVMYYLPDFLQGYTIYTDNKETKHTH
jgi:hypothetical protein